MYCQRVKKATSEPLGFALYPNLWKMPKNARESLKFIDITQVAYFLTAQTDFATAYAAPQRMLSVNIWMLPILTPQSMRSVPSNWLETASKTSTFPPEAQPPRKCRESLIYSIVFDPNSSNWAGRLLLQLHEPMRHTCFVMDQFLTAIQIHSTSSEAPKLLKRMYRLIAAFTDFLNSQRDIKWKMLYPMVGNGISSDVLDEIKDANTLLDAHIGHMQAHKRVEEKAWMSHISTIQHDLRTLTLTLVSVCTVEECELAPALESVTSETMILRPLFFSIRQKRIVVPWILHHIKALGGQSEETKARALVPFPHSFLYRLFWRPYFDAHVASDLQKLQDYSHAMRR